MGFSPSPFCSLEIPKEPTTMSEVRRSKYEEKELRRGPWTVEEDTLLIHYIACHGEGRWNLLASQSGLKRTGKSCRLRWLNYLKPDLKRGDLSPEEQFIILELHSKWGNRWSRIAQYLPGRTDNEIKNYWRTRVQKQAKQLGIDTNDTMFRDAVRCHWMPRLLEKMSSSEFVPSIITTDLDQTPHAPPPCALNPSIQTPFDSFSIYNVSGSQKCSQTISLGSTAQPQFTEVSEFPWCYPGELELGNVNFNILLQGDMCMSNAYDMAASDLPFATASECAAAENNLISNIGDSLLCTVGKFQEWSGF